MISETNISRNPPVWPRSTVDDDSYQVIHPVGVDSVVGGVEQAQLQREDNTVGDLRDMKM